MDSTFVVHLVREALTVGFLVAAPILAVSLAAGILIGLLQAATQIHEMTLVFVPKFVLAGLVIVFLGPWQFSLLVGLARRLLTDLPHYVK